MARPRTLISVFALASTLLAALWLARLEASGPRRLPVMLEGDVPATLYLPAAASPGESAAVVLAHGFASDQAGMSILARALTQAGYAVLTPDLRGHGANRNPFFNAREEAGLLGADLRAAVDFLRASPEVDGSRISVMGHSMGAGAVLEYASRDPGLDAAVMISGGWRVSGPHRPANALFIYGEGDPEGIRTRSAELATALMTGLGEDGAGVARPGVVYGKPGEGRAVSHVEVARADHITILASQYAARQIVGWLDGVYGTERGTFFLRADPRLRAVLIGLLGFVLLLPGLGEAIARLSPQPAERPARGAGRRLVIIAGTLLAALPLVAVGESGRVVGVVLADVVGVHLFAAGVALLGWLVLSRQLVPAAVGSGGAKALGAAAFGLAVVYLLLTPFGVAIHRLSLTPERALVAVVLLALFLPFQLAFHFLLRRGGTFSAAVSSLLGRGLVLAVLVIAVSAGVLSGVVMLMLPVLAGLFVLFEILSSSIYSASRSYVVPALVEAGWMAWIFAAVLPVTL